MVNNCYWIWTWTAVHSWWHLISSPFPTVTRSGVVSVGVSPNLMTTRLWRKLCVLPPSISILIGWLLTRPLRRNVSGAKWPDNAWRLNYAGGDSDRGFGIGDSSRTSSMSSTSFSSSMTNRNKEDWHLCPRENFSSHWKHSPFSRRLANSSGVNLLKGMLDELRVGVGNNGGVVFVDEERVVADPAVDGRAR